MHQIDNGIKENFFRWDGRLNRKRYLKRLLALMGIGSLEPSALLRESGNMTTAEDAVELRAEGAVCSMAPPRRCAAPRSTTLLSACRPFRVDTLPAPPSEHHAHKQVLHGMIGGDG